MTALSIMAPFPVFMDRDGQPLDNGYVWIGAPYLNPQTNPVAVYFDEALTIPAPQPLRTVNGYVSNSGTPAQLYVGGVNFSILVQDNKGTLVYTFPDGSSIDPNAGGVEYQPNVGSLLFPSGPTSVKDALDQVTNNASGSSFVGFTQAGAGAVPRSMLAKGREIVSVKDFGAVGDGVTDDTTAFQNAIDASNALHVPQGKYKITSSIILKSNLSITMDSAAELDFSSAGAVKYFSAAGTAATPITVTSDVAAYGVTIQVKSTETLSVGDMLRLSSNAVFDPNRTSTQIAELVYVKSLTSTTITTTTPIQDSYKTADGAKIEKITPVKNIYLSGGKIFGNSGTTSGDFGFHVNFGENIVVENVYFYNIDHAMVQFANCVGAWVRGCKFELGVSGLAYGVSFADCTRESGCVNSIFNNVRHSLSTNNSAGAAGGVVRRILFANNIVYCSAKNLSGGGSDAIDTHAAAEAISIIGNKCFASSSQGINIECKSAQIIGNEIIDSAKNGINVSNHTSRIGQYQISDNIVIRAGGNGIKVDTFAANAPINNLIVSNNIIRDCTLAFAGILINNNNTDQLISNVSITGNSVLNAQSTSASVQLLSVLNANVTDNVIELAIDGPSGIRLENAINASVGNNSISLISESKTSSGIRIVSATSGASKKVVVTGNTVNSPTAAGSKGISISDNASGVVLSGNNFQDCTTPVSDGTHYIINSDAITIVGDVGAITVDTEGGVATDDLATINGGIDRQILIIRTVSNVRSVTLKDGIGNLQLAGNFNMSKIGSTISLMLIGPLWYELSRSANA